MTLNEAIKLAQEYLDRWEIGALPLRKTYLVPEIEELVKPGFTGDNWYIWFDLPPLPEAFQAIDSDPTVALCVNCLSKQVRRLPG